MKHWVEILSYKKREDSDFLSVGEIEVNSDAFFQEIDDVCEKYGVSISHEDQHGGFIIEEYDKDNIDWLKSAAISHYAYYILKQGK